MASTDRKGTNILGLIEAAEKLGFSAKGCKGPPESLKQIPAPSILHVVVNKVLHHYVVLYGISGASAMIMDPADGKLHKRPLGELAEQWTGIVVLLTPSDSFQTVSGRKTILSRFLQLLAPHRTILAQAFTGAVIYSLLGLATSLYVKNIIDHVLTGGNLNLLSLMSIVMIVFLIIRVYMNVMKSIFALRTGQHIDAALIMGYYRHLLSLPQRFFDTMRVGEIISRVNDAVKIRNFINNTSLELLVNILIVTFSLGLMLIFSMKLTLVVLAGIPFFTVVYVLYNKVNKRYLRKNMENAAELESHLVESLNGVSTIRQFHAEAHANLKSEVRIVSLLKSSFSSVRNSVLSINATEFITGALTIAVLWYGSTLVVQQQMTAGRLLSFYALLGYMISPVSQMISANQVIQDALIAADRLFQIMDLEQEEAKGNKIVLTREMISDIRFADVGFRYGTRVNVFSNFNLLIRKGEVTAFTGESGSGKSTLVALIQKLYPLNTGAIEIGGYNIRHIRSDSLRNLIGVVPQKVELFAGTVAENIAFGTTAPDLQRIVDVCESLNIRKFIEDLPAGFDTFLGEHGVSLSGGERQRIAIARALYHDPEIIILDEATSALDSTSEANITRMIDLLRRQKKTIILIAHRLSTIVHADTICVLHKGVLVEQGSHEALIQRRSHYHEMWRKQIPALAGQIPVNSQ